MQIYAQSPDKNRPSQPKSYEDMNPCGIDSYIIIIIDARSDQPEPPAIAIVRQNGLSSASSRDSVADTPVYAKTYIPQ